MPAPATRVTTGRTERRRKEVAVAVAVAVMMAKSRLRPFAPAFLVFFFLHFPQSPLSSAFTTFLISSLDRHSLQLLQIATSISLAFSPKQSSLAPCSVSQISELSHQTKVSDRPVLLVNVYDAGIGQQLQRLQRLLPTKRVTRPRGPPFEEQILEE